MSFINRHIQRLKGFGLVAFIALVIGLSATGGVALANWFGRNDYQGYFSGVTDYYGDYVLSNGLSADNIDQFVGQIRNYLYGASNQNETGAAFIILTMCSSQTCPRSSRSVAEAKNNFSKWEALVRKYSALGRIDYHQSYSYSYNTYWQGNGGGSNPNDVAGYGDSGTVDSIVFNSTNGDKYVIKRSCGNPIGGLALVDITWTLKGTSTAKNSRTGESIIGGTGTSTISAIAGDVITYTHDIKNLGPNTSESFDSWAQWGLSRTDQVRWRQSPDNGGALSSLPIIANHSAKAANTSIVDRINEFTIPAGAVVGSRYCQVITYNWPTDKTKLPVGTSSEVCAVVVGGIPSSSFTPSVTVPNYEKGAASPSVTFTVTPKAPCVAQTVSWSAIGPYVNPADGSSTSSQTFSFTVNSLCTISPIGGNTRTFSIPNTSLDSMTPGALKYKTHITTPAGIADAEGSMTVYEVPYARFYGNDIYTTGKLADDTGINFNSYDNSNYTQGLGTKNSAGSAAQYAALAYYPKDKKIHSAAFITPASNIDNLTSWWWGWTSSNPSADDTYLLPEQSSSLTGNDSLTGRGSGYYTYDSDEVISGGAGVSSKITIKAKGDIYINGNITVGLIPATFNDASTPVIMLIAEGGNIYIDQNVTQIDAILISKGGIVDTCYNNLSKQSMDRANWSANCRKKLVINGAIKAQDIQFKRSIGTRLKGLATEDSTTAGKNIMANPAPNTTNLAQTAEVINFPAYLYFATPYLGSTSSSGGYQSLFNAAPLL